MGTRAFIAIKDGEIYKAIYTHWDGYPSHHKPILDAYFTTKPAVDNLMGLGDLSILGKFHGTPAGHTFETPVAGYCLAYGRDRGEKDTQFGSYASLKALKESAKNSGAEYLYIYAPKLKSSNWKVYTL